VSFGLTSALLADHADGLLRSRVGTGRRHRIESDSHETGRVADRRHVTRRLSNRVGFTLVEAGLHLMVRARQSASPISGGSAVLRRSSTTHGR
jgi:hypothetical protein